MIIDPGQGIASPLWGGSSVDMLRQALAQMLATAPQSSVPRALPTALFLQNFKQQMATPTPGQEQYNGHPVVRQPVFIKPAQPILRSPIGTPQAGPYIQPTPPTSPIGTPQAGPYVQPTQPILNTPNRLPDLGSLQQILSQRVRY